MNAQAILNLLAGKKTYATAVLIGVLLFGSWQKWWVLPNEIYAGLFTLAVCFIKAGVTRELRKSVYALNQNTGGGLDQAPSGIVQTGVPASPTSTEKPQ